MERRPLRILILGAGVIGRVFAAQLHRGGHHVTALTRPDLVETLRVRGIRLARPRGLSSSVVRGVTFVDRVDPTEQYDYCFVCFRGDQHAEFAALASEWDTHSMRVVICYPAWRATLTPLAGRFGELHYAFPGVSGFYSGEEVKHRLGTTHVAPLFGTKTSAATRLCVVLSMAGLRGCLTPNLLDKFQVQLAVALPFLLALSLHDYDYRAATRDRAAMELAAGAQKECLAILAESGEPLVGAAALTRHMPTPLAVALMSASGYAMRGFLRDMFEVHFRKVHQQAYVMLRELNAWDAGHRVPAPYLQELLARCAAKQEAS